MFRSFMTIIRELYLYLTKVIFMLNKAIFMLKRRNFTECGPCPDFASNTLAFALQLRKNHGKTSVRVAQSALFKDPVRTAL